MSYLEHEIFAIGDIFWNKKSGARVLITKKHDLINHELITKLLNGQMDLEIENFHDSDFIQQIHSWFDLYAEEIQIRKKIFIRDKLIRSLVTEFIRNSQESFKLDMLGWKLFGKLDLSEVQPFIARDLDLFKRNLNICAAFTFSAFLLGFTQEKNLINYYNQKLINLMKFTKKMREKSRPLLIKEELIESEKIELLNALKENDCLEVIIFEKKNGSGPRGFNGHELLDIEHLLVSVITFYVRNPDKNIFKAILDDDLDCNLKIKSILKNEIEKVLINELENVA